MAPDNEPIDDLRAVGMTAAAAVARAVEVVIRDQQNRQARQIDQQQRLTEQTNQGQTNQGQINPGTDQPSPGRPGHVPSGGRRHSGSYRRGPIRRPAPTDDVGDQAVTPDMTAASTPPARPVLDADRPADVTSAAAAVMPDSYDSAQARADRHDLLEAAGVPLEQREARVTADLMNGTDPAGAARSGSRQSTQRPRSRRAVQRERSR